MLRSCPAISRRSATPPTLSSPPCVAAQPELLREAAASGRWATADLLADLGFRAGDGPAPSALHHAAGLGRAALVRKLVEHGADPTAVDDRLQRTPLEWARSIGARLGGPQASGADWPAVIAYLETLPDAGEAGPRLGNHDSC